MVVVVVTAVVMVAVEIVEVVFYLRYTWCWRSWEEGGCVRVDSNDAGGNVGGSGVGGGDGGGGGSCGGEGCCTGGSSNCCKTVLPKSLLTMQVLAC